MFVASVLLIMYWIKTNNLINSYQNIERVNNKFKIFGILSAIFLIIHSILLGVKFDYDLYKFFRRFVLLSFIIFEIVAQSLLVIKFYKLKIIIQILYSQISNFRVFKRRKKSIELKNKPFQDI